ncbi:MAG: heavy-metal-associated domain-containing protein [Dehalococcoidia bacterium]
MPQVTLFAPDVTCDHCIATIQKAVGTVDGARFLEGDPDSKSFAIEVSQGAILDRVAEVLATEGYPLGPATPARAGEGGGQSEATAGFAPAYTIEKSAEGASVTYNCPCGSTTEHYTFDRSKPEQALGSCCDHHLLIQPNAAQRLRERLGDAYEVNVQSVEMPWGQPMEAAFATRKG